MINIKEQTAKKLPGISSLFVTFNYNKDIVEAIKTLPSYNYSAKEKIWEIPITCLAELLDKCCVFDSIDITLLKSKQQESIIYPLSKYKTKPFEYQKDGIQYGLNHQSWLLLDAPGLGKSLQILYLAQELKKRDKIEHCLIVCGVNTLKTNWKNEVEKHTNLSATILGQRINTKGNLVIGSVKERYDQLQKKINEFFVITNIESLRDENIVKGILNGKNKFDMIVVDEVHACLDYRSVIYTDKGLMQIGDIVENRTPCKVLSYNNGVTEYKQVLDYHKHASCTTITLKFQMDDGSIMELICTPDHKIYTHNRGYICACNLTEQDEVEFNNLIKS